ncbi:MCE family protein [Sciscionella marina]|uniref:MCE family protein n=1 Tax=Sciscionella marina TaxID=508770 RepID=UPI000365D417|nr:MCE family protein [Sciscionella marina]
MSATRAGRRRRLAALAGSAALLCSCAPGGFNGLYNVPLPGGADLGAHPFTVRAQFTDVLDLVPQAMVKVNDVAAGRVDRVELAPDNKTAIVTMDVNGDVHLPANATATLRQSSLLGEKFIELGGPKNAAPNGTLHGGGTIPVSRTNRNAEVEEVLGALSLLLNNGGIQQVQNITHELNGALDGREPELRATLSRLRDLAHQLNGQRDNITRAIDGLNTLSATVSTQRKQLADGLDAMEPGLRSANQQRDQIVAMLGSLRRLSSVATDTINRSRDDLLDDLRTVAPTLRQLAKAGSNIPKSMQILLSYPFADYAMNSLKGDYFNADLDMDLRLDVLAKNAQNSKMPLIPPLFPDPDKSGAQQGNQAQSGEQQQPGQPASGQQQAQEPQGAAPPKPPPGLGGVFDSVLGGGK